MLGCVCECRRNAYYEGNTSLFCVAIVALGTRSGFTTPKCEDVCVCDKIAKFFEEMLGRVSSFLI